MITAKKTLSQKTKVKSPAEANKIAALRLSRPRMRLIVFMLLSNLRFLICCFAFYYPLSLIAISVAKMHMVEQKPMPGLQVANPTPIPPKTPPIMALIKLIFVSFNLRLLSLLFCVSKKNQNLGKLGAHVCLYLVGKNRHSPQGGTYLPVSRPRTYTIHQPPQEVKPKPQLTLSFI